MLELVVVVAVVVRKLAAVVVDRDAVVVMTAEQIRGDVAEEMTKTAILVVDVLNRA